MRKDIIQQAISRYCSDGSEPGHRAEATVSVLRLLHAELALLVGSQASTALVAHAVHRTRARFEWAVSSAVEPFDVLLQTLDQDLAARTTAECSLAGESLLSVLIDHLVSLIGEPLTLRMLNSAWSTHGADRSSQENF